MTNNETASPAERKTHGATRHHLVTLDDGIRLHCLLTDPETILPEGVRGTFVLLHGWSETATCWDRVTPFLTAGGYAVVAPDLRGLGGSSRATGGYDKKTMAGDIFGLVRSLGLGPIHLVGYDIGAMVAYAYARQWPEETANLVLVEGPIAGAGLEAMFGPSKPGQFAHFAFHMAPDGLPEALVAGREDAYLGWFFRTYAFDQGAFTPEVIAANARAYAAPGALKAGFDLYRAFWQDIQDNKAFAARGKLAMPVLSVGGANSLGDTVTRALAPMADDLRGLVIEECGHYVPVERPERFASEILAFCGGAGR